VVLVRENACFCLTALQVIQLTAATDARGRDY